MAGARWYSGESGCGAFGEGRWVGVVSVFGRLVGGALGGGCWLGARWLLLAGPADRRVEVVGCVRGSSWQPGRQRLGRR